MTNAEAKLKYIIAHRGEPECDRYIRILAEAIDEEIVEETMDHIRGGYYTIDDPEGFADSAEDVKDVFANQICKRCYAYKRERKIADNREHQRKLKLLRGVIVNA